MNAKIIDAAAITANFPDGQKLVEIQVTFDTDPGFIPENRVCVLGKQLLGMQQSGNKLMLSLKPEGLIPLPQPSKGEKRPPKPGNVPDFPPAVRLEPKAAILVGGTLVETNRSIEPVVEDFRQLELGGMAYNLFAPKLEEGKRYPLVLFLHDASGCGPNPKTALSQGNGAVSFASPEWQRENPCFVLAPQIGKEPYGPMTSDDFQVTPDLERVVAILSHVMREYPVDDRRVYTTGQSMGCMASCELNIRYSELFAASLLVAGQWDPEKMAEKCADANLWILVSGNDAKAFPGMNAATEAMEVNGASVYRYTWDAKRDDLEEQARLARKDTCNVRYTVFADSSVVPEGIDPNPGMNHIFTWPVVYEITELKRWLFSCMKG